MKTRMIDVEGGNLCDYCFDCIAECAGNIKFNEANPNSDNVIECDAFQGVFNPIKMTQSAADGDGQ